ncbi:MAG: zinc ribbon domain-containing protein [Candidatus Borkfalkiaceae bacterium]|nr:zinc ribbon domain-containing protein [Christensenellaceae bacterium]
MNEFISNLRKPAKLFILIFAGAYALFELLYAIGIMSQGGTDLIFGGLFFLLFFVGLVIILFFALIKKNEKVSKMIGYIFFSFIFLQSLYGLLNGKRTDSGVSTAMFVFDILATLFVMANFCFIILKTTIEKLRNNKTINIIQLSCLAGFLFCTLVARSLEFGVYGQFANAWGIAVPWYEIMRIISDILVLPALMFGYILLFMEVNLKEKTNEITIEENIAVKSDEEVISVTEVENTDTAEDVSARPVAPSNSQTVHANFCPNCGTKSNGGAFCPKCGTKL